MAKKCRVPEVLWKLFKNRARTLAETILSLIPPPPSTTVQCHCRGRCYCLRCYSDGDRLSFLLRDDDPSDYRYLLNLCFVVVSDNAPSPPPFDPNSRQSQLQIVRSTIEMISRENNFTKNVICTNYSKYNDSNFILDSLTSASWCLLLKRVGDGLMMHLLKYASIFIPLHRKKHHQVAGNPINELCWQILKHKSESKNQQPSTGVAKRYPEVAPVSMNIDIPESSMNIQKDSIHGVDFSQSQTTQNKVLSVANKFGKRSRSHNRPHRHKRRKLSSQNTCETNNSLPEETKKVANCCCSIWQTLQKLPNETNISKRSMLHKVERGSSILPGKNILNSLKPNSEGANTLFKEIFGFTDSAQPTSCSHKNDISVKTTCLYHSLHKLLKILIRKTINCPRLRLLNKHIFLNANDGESSMSEKALYCSKSQVVSFIWAACRSIVPQELLGSSSNYRILTKNIFKLISLRLHEKFSLHQCIQNLKISNFPFLSDTCNSITKRDILQRWIYWLFNHLVVPLLQANFFITESDKGKFDVFFYEKSLWENMMKSSISSLKEQCYSLLDTISVRKIVSRRTFGFSRVRFRPKTNGIRPLSNLRSPSRLLINNGYKDFKPVNIVLRDLHAVLKDKQFEKPEKLGSSVFSYNDVHIKLVEFLSCLKNGLNELPCLYMVVADVEKAYDSINQDKLLDIMKYVVNDDHRLHQTQQIVASKGFMQICQQINKSRRFHSRVHARSSHSVLVNQGRNKKAMKGDLLFNLEQHIKYNVLHINKTFYRQNVGIPQGSILSSLLCSFYFGHMENTKLVPYLNTVTETENSKFSGRNDLLFRFMDDFCYISTSKKQALAFYSRLKRGFFEYNCKFNKEKFGLSFDIDNISPSKRLYFDENGNKFLQWSGLFINCKTLEVQADYTRYLDGHLRSTLTVCWHKKPGRHFKEKLCDYLRPKCHAIFYDLNINSASVIRLNIYQAFLLCAMKFHCYVCDLFDTCTLNSGIYLDIINNSIRFMYKLIKRRMYSKRVGTDLRPILGVKKMEIEWLGLRAYFEVLKRKQSRYKGLLYFLDLKLKSFTVEWVSPALKFAVDKSNSSVVWKIKY